MSLLLAVGSPALITFSLSMTVFNRRWVQERFTVLRRKINGRIDDRVPSFKGKVEAMQYLLENGQQVALRCSEIEGSFSSLVVLPQNKGLLKGIEKDLKNTKRPVTFSLVAQQLFAISLYIFTVIDSFPNSGMLTTPTQMSASGLWTWMIPVCGGWVFVGTQCKPGSIARALGYGCAAAYIAHENGSISPAGDQRGLRSTGGLNPALPQRGDLEGQISTQANWWHTPIYEPKDPIF
jgi:hypothetical protein